MKRKLLTLGLLVVMLAVGSVQAFAADTEKVVFVCPNGYENCIQAGACVYGECPYGVCPNGYENCILAGACVYGECPNGVCNMQNCGHNHGGTHTASTGYASRGHHGGRRGGHCRW